MHACPRRQMAETKAKADAAFDFFVEAYCVKYAPAVKYLTVTSRKVIGLFLEQLRLQFVPVLHRLQGRLAAQG